MVQVKGQPLRKSEDNLHTIGEVAMRADIATSALRFYEQNGLVSSERTAAGHRRYHSDVLRRLGFIRTAQRVGLSLEEIRGILSSLPDERTPTAKDWDRLAKSWRPRLDEQIELLTKLRNELDECIGCGCLSLKVCKLQNPGDIAAEKGNGPRYLLEGDEPVKVAGRG